jgi:chromosome segregation ATPase
VKAKQLEADCKDSAALKAELDALKTDVEAKLAEIKALKEEVGDKEKIIEQLKEENEKLKSDVEKQGDVEALKKDISKNQTDIENLKADVEAKQAEVKALKTEVGDKEKEIEQLKEQNQRLKSDVEKQGDVENLKEEASKNLLEIKNLKADVEAKHAEITTLKSEAVTKQGEIASLNSRVTDLQSDIANLNSEAAIKKTELEKLATEKSAIESARAKLEAELTSANSTHEAAVKSLTDELQALKDKQVEQGSSEASEIADLKQAKKIAEASLAEHEKKADALKDGYEREVEQLKKDIAEANSNLKIEQEQNSKSSAENKELILKSESQTQDLTALQGKLADLQTLHSETSTKLESMTKQADLLRDEVKAAHEAKRSALQDLEVLKEQHITELADLSARLSERPAETAVADSLPGVRPEVAGGLLAEAKQGIEARDAELEAKLALCRDELPKIDQQIETKLKEHNEITGKGKEKKQKAKKAEIEELEQKKKGLLAEIAKLEAALTESPSKQPTIEIKAPEEEVREEKVPEGQPPAEVVTAHKAESEKAAVLHEQESTLDQWRLHLEKVFDHVALLDVEIRERNADLEAVASDVVKAEKFKDCLKQIVEVLKMTVAGIKKIGEQSGVQVDAETEIIAKQADKIEQVVIETHSKPSSARELLLEKEHPQVKVTETQTDPETEELRPVDIESEEEKLKAWKEQLKTAGPDLKRQKHEWVRALLLEEKMADHLAILTAHVKEYTKKLLVEQERIKDDEAAIKLLNEAHDDLAKLLSKPTREDHSMVIPEGLREEISASLKTLEELKLKTSTLSSETLHANEIATELKSGITSLEHQIKDSNSQFEIKQKEIEHLKKTKDQLEKDLANQEQSSDVDGGKLKSEIESLENQLQEKKKKSSSLTAEKDQLTSQRDDLSNALNSLDVAEVEKNISELNNQINDLLGKIAARKKEIEEKRSQAISLSEKSEELMKELHSIEKPDSQNQEIKTQDDSTLSPPKKHFDRTNSIKEEHVGYTVNPSPDSAMEEPLNIDRTSIEELISQVSAELDKQHSSADAVHELKEKVTKLRLTRDKLVENVLNHDNSIKDLQASITADEVSIDQLEKDVAARDELIRSLNKVLEISKKIKGNNRVVKLCTDAKDLIERVASDVAEKSKIENLIQTKIKETERATLKALLPLLRRLSMITQEGTMGFTKAICCLSDMSHEIDQSYRERYKTVSDNLDDHFDELEEDYDRISKGSPDIDSITNYLQKQIEFEPAQLEQLDQVFDAIYERLPSRRSSRQSPETRK